MLPRGYMYVEKKYVEEIKFIQTRKFQMVKKSSKAAKLSKAFSLYVCMYCIFVKLDPIQSTSIDVILVVQISV